MDRQEVIEFLVDHFENPQHRRKMEDADVSMPGGNPGCGDVIVVYMRSGEGSSEIEDYSWEGEGCTISQAAASVVAELVHEEGWTMEDVLALDYDDLIDILGREVVQTRTRCATLALGTLKASIRKLQRDRELVAAGRGDLVADSDIDLNDLERFGIVIGDAAFDNR